MMVLLQQISNHVLLFLLLQGWHNHIRRDEWVVLVCTLAHQPNSSSPHRRRRRRRRRRSNSCSTRHVPKLGDRSFPLASSKQAAASLGCSGGGGGVAFPVPLLLVVENRREQLGLLGGHPLLKLRRAVDNPTDLVHVPRHVLDHRDDDANLPGLLQVVGLPVGRPPHARRKPQLRPPAFLRGRPPRRRSSLLERERPLRRSALRHHRRQEGAERGVLELVQHLRSARGRSSAEPIPEQGRRGGGVLRIVLCDGGRAVAVEADLLLPPALQVGGGDAHRPAVLGDDAVRVSPRAALFHGLRHAALDGVDLGHQKFPPEFIGGLIIWRRLLLLLLSLPPQELQPLSVPPHAAQERSLVHVSVAKVLCVVVIVVVLVEDSIEKIVSEWEWRLFSIVAGGSHSSSIGRGGGLQ
ncbi:ETHYLENE-INSENSITIVE3-like 1 protein isoform X1 [Iris pallida]|uniref:ETHYLENE-INSENSITIVE3-like 1 protein isoform X1 n=1 Tax=Iris pallida TaxID=29817 RepID=A0AAX6EHK2_IRIPA|nr:ETHYLENE-INSENSITIVE3-like 1 protein isoform X1 [Iris pallida]